MQTVRTTSWAAFAAVAVWLAGCAAKPVSLEPRAAKALGAVQTVLYIPQTNLEIDVVAGNPGATGLLGALIVVAMDDARRSAAAKMQASVSDATQGFDFKSYMDRQLSAELARVQSANFQTPVPLETTDTPSLRRIAYDNSVASALLFTNVSYKLISGELVVKADAVMFPRSAALMGMRPQPDEKDPLALGNAIFNKTFTFKKQQIDRSNVRGYLLEAIGNLAWQIAVDLNHAAGSPQLDALLARPLPLPLLSTIAPATPAVASAAPPKPLSADDSARLRGEWAGDYSCGAYRATAANVAFPEGWNTKVTLAIGDDGQATLARRGDTVSEDLSGRVDGDFQLSLRGEGVNPKNPKSRWTTQFSGRLNPTENRRGNFSATGTLTLPDGTVTRECRLNLQQRSVAQAARTN